MNWKKLIPAYIKIKSLYTIEKEKTINIELTHLFKLIDDDKYDDAEKMLDELRKKYGYSVPELSRASSMISFMKAPLID